MFRRKNSSQSPRRVRVAVPYGHGTSVSSKSPPLSSAQNQAYTMELAGIPRPDGGAMGCSYTGFKHGVVCDNTGGMPNYVQSPTSFTGEWSANVKGGFPLPDVQSPGGYEQIVMGGGSGSPECAEVCTCLGDASCPCRNAPGQNCGYSSVNQSCVEPIPGGEYPSLAACEAANARGNYRM
jgi:hypothetical protein